MFSSPETAIETDIPHDEVGDSDTEPGAAGADNNVVGHDAALLDSLQKVAQVKPCKTKCKFESLTITFIQFALESLQNMNIRDIKADFVDCKLL